MSDQKAPADSGGSRWHSRGTEKQERDTEKQERGTQNQERRSAPKETSGKNIERDQEGKEFILS